jgi:hypothetical protein
MKKVVKTKIAIKRDISRLNENNEVLYQYLKTLINARPCSLKTAYTGKATFSVVRLIEILNKPRYETSSIVPVILVALESLNKSKGDEVNTYYLLQSIYNVMLKHQDVDKTF